MRIEEAAIAGVFVTLHVSGELNGCIGSIDGAEPLGQVVARHAWSAAFADPRLPPLPISDYPALSIEVSVLSPLRRIASGTREDVIKRLRPGEDGLVLEQGPRRALFLPSVWAQIPDPERFLDHLLYKAGMRPGSWPGGIRAWCFTTQTFSRPAGRRAEATTPASSRSDQVADELRRPADDRSPVVSQEDRPLDENRVGDHRRDPL